MPDLGYSSKLNAEWDFLSMLRGEGRKAAQSFLNVHGAAVGRDGSLTLFKMICAVAFLNDIP